MSNISDRIRQAMEKSDMSYGTLSQITKIPKSALQRYGTGETGKVPLDRIEKIAQATGVDARFLLGWESDAIKEDLKTYFSYDNIMPLPETRTIPLLGEIACGEPILAEENILDYVQAPVEINADFVLRCKGDSMINARIFDGDIVYIHQQPEVENGEVAAVLVDGEVTLKRFYKTENKITLRPENPLYKDQIYTEGNEIRVLGKAVAFTSLIR